MLSTILSAARRDRNIYSIIIGSTSILLESLLNKINLFLYLLYTNLLY